MLTRKLIKSAWYASPGEMHLWLHLCNCKETRNISLSYAVHLFRYLEPFRHDSRVRQTDGRTSWLQMPRISL